MFAEENEGRAAVQRQQRTEAERGSGKGRQARFKGRRQVRIRLSYGVQKSSQRDRQARIPARGSRRPAPSRAARCRRGFFLVLLPLPMKNRKGRVKW